MALRVSELFEKARRVELELAKLYEELAAHFKPGSDEGVLFARLSAQEHAHAAWVDEMAAAADGEAELEGFEARDFDSILSTIDDLRDEARNSSLKRADTVEIVLHLESSTAEKFYLHFPEEVPGLPRSLIERMIESCRAHVREVTEFRDRHAG